MNILLVEDDPVLARGLQINLESEKYQVSWANSLKTAFEKNKTEKIDLVILDLGLTDGSGFDFLTDLRSKGSTLPVIILTAQTDEDTVVEGLQRGANDYMKKPFSNRELIARMRAILKEPHLRENNIRYGDLILAVDQRTIKYKDKIIDMNRREFDVLLCLIKKAETIVTRDMLMQSLDKEGEIFDRTIDSHVSHLRSRFKSHDVTEIKISSIYGLGYRLEKA